MKFAELLAPKSGKKSLIHSKNFYIDFLNEARAKREKTKK